MSKNSNQIGTILASVFITLIISGAGMYFGLPLLYPNLSEDFSNYVQSEELDDYVQSEELDDFVRENETSNSGILVQSQYYEINTMDSIEDNDRIAEPIENTTLDFTTQGGTKLKVSFDAVFLLRLFTGYSSSTMYNITLSVKGIQNKSVGIRYHSGPVLSVGSDMTDSLHISFETATLSAGTYSILAYWNSEKDVPSVTTLLYTSHSEMKYPRSIFVEEITV